MELDGILNEIAKNEKIKIERKGDNNIWIFIGHRLPDVLKIYPKTKTAEFLDVEDEWEELGAAVKEKYEGFPGVEKLLKYLNKNGYDIIW